MLFNFNILYYNNIINLKLGFKEQMVEQEQTLIVFKQRFREAQDELEELRSLIQDQAAQLEDYRNKYLQVLFYDISFKNVVIGKYKSSCVKIGTTTSGRTTATA